MHSGSDLFADLPADDLDRPDEYWFIERGDRDPASEFARQTRFLSMLRKMAPAIDAIAVPNAGRSTDWERVRRWREGARAGALDLVVVWKPTKPGDRGVFFPEFKDGQGKPSDAQRARLNLYHRMGHKCGVYRRPATLLLHLQQAGAPFLIPAEQASQPKEKKRGNDEV